jgi:hypothetical protein
VVQCQPRQEVSETLSEKYLKQQGQSVAPVGSNPVPQTRANMLLHSEWPSPLSPCSTQPCGAHPRLSLLTCVSSSCASRSLPVCFAPQGPALGRGGPGRRRPGAQRRHVRHLPSEDDADVQTQASQQVGTCARTAGDTPAHQRSTGCGVAQVVRCLPGKHKALTSTPALPKHKKAKAQDSGSLL